VDDVVPGFGDGLGGGDSSNEVLQFGLGMMKGLNQRRLSCEFEGKETGPCPEGINRVFQSSIKFSH
jgi:hypothetical protein